MSGGGKADNTLYDNSIGWALMLVIFAVLIWIFWVFFDTEIRDLVRWIRYGEMWLVSWFLPSDYTFRLNGQEVSFFDYFHGFDEKVPHRARSGDIYYRVEHTDGVTEYSKAELAFEHLALFSAMAMQPFKWPILIMLAAATLWSMLAGPGTQYRRKLDLEGLINAQSRTFPVVAPFVKFNPSTQPTRAPGSPVPVELPAFAEALGPEEWLAYNNIQVPDGNIDEESASAAFIEQLGAPWRGSKRLEPYKQILLAAFCLKASRKRNEAEAIIGRLAMCWSFKEGLKLSKDRKLLSDARNILRDKDIAGATLSKMNRHAYEATAMVRALQFAREEGGVLPSSQFVWLRAHDRKMWYPLNNLGRQSFHMEALGTMSHFKAEKLTQRPIPVPKVEHAVETIKEYMKSLRARPIPQLDYSMSKKRGIKKAV